MASKKMGRKIDTIYAGDNFEFGALETGSKDDQTKEIKDGRLKLPLVMKDILLNIVCKVPGVLNKVHIIGYCINGNKLEFLDMDCPQGYVTRVRRLNQMEYPIDSID
ncbi:uncharacterized protein BX663DRAFT_219078 [Cokeromyces recurvatus]|uniref:uncharacterized protein n=1 Tax=Cokeromyces recurvatus TaxID=90255 RepID=UPI002221210D|nr:uncharacterized protein BX663DRAFT_219078 [Cokeromyces recurvatus]KAI7899317.1 hypothetical protein BX663DRAFT_219078 [Cokeromyces recurvatus]